MSEEIEVTKEMLLEALSAWKDYPAGIEALSAENKAAFLEKQGYPSAHALLSHIVGWWEEAYAIADAALAGRERPRREYDFDVFNAEAIEHFKAFSEAEMLSHYEAVRQKLVSLVSGMAAEQMQNKRARRWLYGVVIHHAEEHAIS
jgi:hypothetical protein